MHSQDRNVELGLQMRIHGSSAMAKLRTHWVYTGYRSSTCRRSFTPQVDILATIGLTVASKSQYSSRHAAFLQQMAVNFDTVFTITIIQFQSSQFFLDFFDQVSGSDLIFNELGSAARMSCPLFSQ